MADDSDVIKDFLVRIGYSVDKPSQTKVTRGISEVEGLLKKLAAFATSAAVAGLFLKMADDMDKLYWASKRLNSSAGDIRGFEYAIGQLGGTAAGAHSALENIAKFMRRNPGSGGFLQSLGIPTRDIGNSAAVARDLGGPRGALSRMPEYLRYQYGDMLGIDDVTLQAMMRDNGSGEGKYSRFMKSIGLNMDELTKKSMEFSNSVREFKADGGLIIGGLGLQGLQAIQPYLDDFSSWIDKFTKGGGGSLGDLVRDFEGLGGAIEKLVGALADLGKSNAFKDWADGVLKGMGYLIQMTTHFVTMLADIAKGDFKGAGAEGAAAAKDMVKAPLSAVHGVARAIEDATGQNGRSNGGASGGKTFDVTTPDKAYRWLVAQGLSAAIAQGVVAGAFAEGGFAGKNSTPGAHDVGQWRGGRWKSLVAKYGANPSASQQWMFLLSEIMGGDPGGKSILGSGSSMEAFRNYINHFMRPGPGTGADMRRGGKFLATHNFGGALMPRGQSGGVTLSQKTEIHLHGTSADAATQVATAQDRVNDRMVRNFTPAIY